MRKRAKQLVWMLKNHKFAVTYYLLKTVGLWGLVSLWFSFAYVGFVDRHSTRLHGFLMGMAGIISVITAIALFLCCLFAIVTVITLGPELIEHMQEDYRDMQRRLAREEYLEIQKEEVKEPSDWRESNEGVKKQPESVVENI